jgi:hypothetical protein
MSLALARSQNRKPCSLRRPSLRTLLDLRLWGGLTSCIMVAVLFVTFWTAFQSFCSDSELSNNAWRNVKKWIVPRKLLRQYTSFFGYY